MRWDGETDSHEQKLESLIEVLHRSDYRIDDHKLSELLEFGAQAVPLLEEILVTAIKKSSRIHPKSLNRDRDWFVVIHALYLLAELKSNDSLGIILQFLAAKQHVLDYWLHELFDENIWEIIFFVGNERLELLQTFMLEPGNNPFSRLAACTALVQIALHEQEKEERVVDILKKALEQPSEDSDYTGLIASEMLDLRHDALRIPIIKALKRDDVWSGIISVADVNLIYEKSRVRKLQPLGIFERYRILRQSRDLGSKSTKTSLTEYKQKKS